MVQQRYLLQFREVNHLMGKKSRYYHQCRAIRQVNHCPCTDVTLDTLTYFQTDGKRTSRASDPAFLMALRQPGDAYDILAILQSNSPPSSSRKCIPFPSQYFHILHDAHSPVFIQLRLRYIRNPLFHISTKLSL